MERDEGPLSMILACLWLPNSVRIYTDDDRDCQYVIRNI